MIMRAINWLIFVSILMVNTTYALTVDVRKCGAKGDGKTVNTEAIQKAIDKCYEAGGGKVVFENGEYVTGTIYLKDKVSLYIDRSATILGSTNIADYPINKVDFEFRHSPWIRQALIFAYKADQICIEGDGTINGRGESFPIDRKSTPRPHPWKNRPFIIWFSECTNVAVRNVELRNSPMWMQLYLGCESVQISGLRIYNHVNENNDMMDVAGCKNVTISNIIGSSDDDGITLKGFSNHPSENITVTNCVLSSHCNAIKIGTETNAPFRNITINNCVVKKSDGPKRILGRQEGISGISIESVDGSVIDGVTITNIVLDGPQVPIFVRLGNRGLKVSPDSPKPEIGAIRNVSMSNIVARASSLIGNSISGIPGGSIEKLTMDNIRFICTGGGEQKHVRAQVPERENSYPEAWMFGVLPSYGLYIRHADHIRLSNITFDLENEDVRPAMYLDDVNHCKIDGVVLEGCPTTRLCDQINSTNLDVTR